MRADPLVLLAAIALTCLPRTAAAAVTNIPDIRLVSIAEGFTMPVHLAPAPGSNRVYVVEQNGVIRQLVPGGKEHPVFLDIRDRVDWGGERGLLSVAFHPGYAANGRLFVDYTTKANGQLTTRISEFAAAPDRRTADAASERILLTFPQPHANHNGGLVAFGPDGKLYIGNGDGGSANDPHGNGQRLDTVLGKLLRVDIDRVLPGLPYGIPPDNPFVDHPGARPEIFAYGLRNPWRFSFDRATGAIWCGDVGQNTREEIDVVERGRNYGWRIMEGTISTPGVNDAVDVKGLVPPIIDYPRSEGVSVTGGYVYRGKRIPALRGVYLYGDFGSGNYWGLRYEGGRITSQRKLIAHGPPMASFGESPDGELYVVGYGGTIYGIDTK